MTKTRSEALLAPVKTRWNAIKGTLNERQRRQWAAAEAIAIGYGGQTILHKATGMSCLTIAQGIQETKETQMLAPTRQRKSGAGRKRVCASQPKFGERIQSLLESSTRGDPQSPLRWTIKSASSLQHQLRKEGVGASASTILRWLRANGYTLRRNRRVVSDGAQHKDRNAQFEYIAQSAKEALDGGHPVLSVDTKKTELVGHYANKGSHWCRKNEPILVRDHEFYNPDSPKAHPYGIYDAKHNRGFVVVGKEHDTAQFAVSAISAWWAQVGRAAYPAARRIVLNADCGGSNGYRVRLWKLQLQHFADSSGLVVQVRHYPPGTSKWNPIEHRLFSFISLNWRGHPLSDYETVVNLIGGTSNKKGLRVDCQLDERSYPVGVKVSDKQYQEIQLFADAFCPDWNYEIRPKNCEKVK